MRYKNNNGSLCFRQQLTQMLSLICFLLFGTICMGQSDPIAGVSKNTVVYNSPVPSDPPQNYRPLSLGEDMPDINFSMLNYSADNAHASQFKGKLLLLDFWATWCGSCIAKFPILDSIQEVYKDKLQIILVNSKITGDNEVQVKKFLEKRKKSNGQSYQLAVAVMDINATDLFPHQVIPHYAWIGPDGRVKAVTGAHEVTGENIEAILKGKQSKMVQKKDFSPDKLMDFGQGEFPVDDNLAHYSFFRKGKMEGLSMVNQPRSIDHNGITIIRGKAMRNLSLIEMYTEAIFQNKSFSDTYSDRRLLLETKDRSKLIFDPSLSSKEEWEKKNLYTYDLVIPRGKDDSLYNYIIDDLNRYSGFYGRVEKRKVKYWALVRTSKVDKIKTKGGDPVNALYNDAANKGVHNLSISEMMGRMERLDAFKIPVLDETGYKGNIDLELNVNLNDPLAVRKALQKYDLDLVSKEKLLDVFVITEK